MRLSTWDFARRSGDSTLLFTDTAWAYAVKFSLPSRPMVCLHMIGWKIIVSRGAFHYEKISPVVLETIKFGATRFNDKRNNSAINSISFACHILRCQMTPRKQYEVLTTSVPPHMWWNPLGRITFPDNWAIKCRYETRRVGQRIEGETAKNG